MNSAFVVRLGSGSAARHGVGSKGKMLDIAARAGLPVPRGIIILDTAADLAVLHGAADQIDGQLRITDPQKLAMLLELPPFTRPVAVRSAFSAEDNEETAMAGYFRTVLNVDPTDVEALSGAIGTVWLSAKLPDVSEIVEDAAAAAIVRRDVLVMDMVTPQVAGVAFTEQEFEDDLVNYTTGTAERLLSGEISGEAMSLPKLRGWEKFPLPGDLPPWAARLQALLRDVRRWLGARNWDVEWADDGTTCWLLQLRPVTRPTLRDEVFSIANHKEILPPLPSPFMTSVVESCAFDLYGYYRDFDPSLPKKRPFLEVFYGRPYINLSLMAETMRSWGLPTRLVTDNIGGAAEKAYGFNIRRILTKTWRLTLIRQAVAQILSARRTRQVTLTLDAKLAATADTLEDYIEAARWLYITLVRQMFALLAASGPMVSLLAWAGVLAELNAHTETISTRKFRAQEEMRAYVAAHPELAPVLRNGELPDDAGFRTLWDAYIAEFGHRGMFESDLSRPRDSEQPAPVLQSLANPPLPEEPKRKRRLRAWVMWPLWIQASRTITAREQWRHDVMCGFAIVRAGLLRAAQSYVESGALPTADHLWLLRVAEVKQLATGWCPTKAFWAERQAEIAELERISPPELLRRYDGLPDAGDVLSDTTFHGIPLTHGAREGRAWVLHEPASVLPDGFTRETTILVARSVDVGWVSTFGLVTGVVVETGGHLSHGSIVLRELGLPAVTNVTGATRAFSTGEPLTLDAGRGIVKRASKTGE